MGFVRNITGAEDRKQAKKQAKQADALNEKTIALSQEQFDWQKQVAADNTAYQREQAAKAREINAANRQKLEEDYQRRLSLSGEMVNDATFTPSDYNEAIAGSAASVRDAADAAKSNTDISLRRYGVGPGDERYINAISNIESNTGLGAAMAKNTTRTAMRENERDNIASAKSLGLGITRPTIGGDYIAPSDSSLGMVNPVINATANAANQKTAVANQFAASGAQKLGSLMELGGRVGAAVATGGMSEVANAGLNAVKPKPTTPAAGPTKQYYFDSTIAA